MTMKPASGVLCVGLLLVGCGSEDVDRGSTSGAGGSSLLHAGPPPPEDGGPVPPSEGCAAPSSNIYYVSPTGDDAAPGTQASPWRTLAKATASVGPGDTVYLTAGTYAEQLVPQVSGTDGHYITFAVDPAGGPATIDGSTVALDQGGLVQIGRSYINVCGLTVRSSPLSGVAIGQDSDEVPAWIHLVDLDVESSGEAAIYVEGASGLGHGHRRARVRAGSELSRNANARGADAHGNAARGRRARPWLSRIARRHEH